jgi:NADPH-dependent 2,4-dienoyl-CoA reductase/sulfur reductase-like enzyme
VPDWRTLAHRTKDDLQNAGLQLHLNERAVGIDVDTRSVSTVTGTRETRSIGYDRLVIATGAVPNKPPIAGIGQLGADDGLTSTAWTRGFREERAHRWRPTSSWSSLASGLTLS